MWEAGDRDEDTDHSGGEITRPLNISDVGITCDAEEISEHGLEEIFAFLDEEHSAMHGFVEECFQEQTAMLLRCKERLTEQITHNRGQIRTLLRTAFPSVPVVTIPKEGVVDTGLVAVCPVVGHVDGDANMSSTTLASETWNLSIDDTYTQKVSGSSSNWDRKRAVESAYRVTSEMFSNQVRPYRSRAWKDNPVAALNAGSTSKLVNSHTFQIAVCLAIALYIIFVGIELNRTMELALWNHAQRRDGVFSGAETDGWIVVLGYCFTCFFVVELIVRVVAHKAQFVFGDEWSWNMFDTVLVVTSVADQTLSADFGFLHNLSYLRFFRMLWIFRALRLINGLHSRFVRDLRLMLLALMSSVIPLFWAITTLLFLHYLFSVFLMTVVSNYISDAAGDDATVDELAVWFHSVPMAILTLFMAITGGVSWWEIMEPVLVVGPVAGFILVFFVVLSVLAVLNIITGIFVNDAIEKARSDHELLVAREIEQNLDVRKQLKAVFKRLDTHHRGGLSLNDFCEQMEDREVQAIFSLMGVEVTDTKAFFQLLDVDNTELVELDEFVMGCMRFKSKSSQVSMECSILEIKKMTEKSLALERITNENLAELTAHLS